MCALNRMRESRVYGVDDWRASRRCARRSFRLRGLAIAFVICVCASRTGPAASSSHLRRRRRRRRHIALSIVDSNSIIKWPPRNSPSHAAGRGHRAPEKPLSVGARFITVSPTIASHFTPPLRLNSRGVRSKAGESTDERAVGVLSVCTRLAIGPIDSTVAGRPAPSTPADQTGRNARGSRRCGALVLFYTTMAL